MEPQDVSSRSRGVALALAAAIGPFGAHRFYVGKIGSGVCMALTLGGFGIWYLYDLITIAAGVFRDADDTRVWRWTEYGRSDEMGSRRLPTNEHLEAIYSELDALRAEMSEFGERVDFMERMLIQSREADQLPPRASSPSGPR